MLLVGHSEEGVEDLSLLMGALYLLDTVKRVFEDLSLLRGALYLLDTVKRVFEDLSLLRGACYLLDTVKRVIEDLILLKYAGCVLDTVKRVLEDLSLLMLAHRSSACGVSLSDDGCFMHWAVVTCSCTHYMARSLGCCYVLTSWPGLH